MRSVNCFHGGLQVETSDGPLELRFTAGDAARLVAGLQTARKDLQALRVKTGKPLGKPRTAERWDTSIDPVEQQAVLRTHFTDGTAEEEALKRFESGAEMRQ